MKMREMEEGTFALRWLVPSQHVSETRFSRLVQTKLLCHLGNVRIGATPDEGTLLHLSHFHAQGARRAPRLFQLLPQREHVRLKGRLSALHDLVETSDLAVLDVE